MRARPPLVLLPLSIFFSHLGCGDDTTRTDAVCDASAPTLVTALPPDLGDYVTVTPIGSRYYLNIHAAERTDKQPAEVNRPDYLYIGQPTHGQTWVTGLCGESPVRVGDGGYNDVFPVLRSDDADPTLACKLDDIGASSIYKIDLTGAAPPKLLLKGWSCDIDPARPVAEHRDGSVYELWHVPGYPDLTDAALLAEDIFYVVAHDAEYSYYLGRDDALHAVDLTGADEILEPAVSRVIGGPTDSVDLQPPTGPTRLLLTAKRTGEPEAVYLYRGETRTTLKLADTTPSDAPEGTPPSLAWDINHPRTHILHQSRSDPLAAVSVYDLEGAPVVVPDGIHASLLGFSVGGVLGHIAAPEGRRWVFAEFGSPDPIPLDIPYDGEQTHPFIYGPDYLYYYDPRIDQLFLVPHDGSPALAVPDKHSPYGDDNGAVGVHNKQLFHLDRRTGATEILQSDVGAYGPARISHNDRDLRGVFYSDISSANRTTVWFLPTALLRP